MAIRLKWKNPNTGNNVVKIYRSATPIDTANMAGVTPIVEITDGSTTYMDEFPKYGQTFYYVFSITVNGREIFTINKQYSALIDLGPGPKDITIGDFRLGYFGPCTTGDLGIPSNLYGANFYTLHKIARNGKILYLPGTAINTTVNALVANKVFTSGVTAKSDPYAGAAGRIIDINGRLFAPRVAKVYDEANADTNNANYGVSSGLGFTAPAYPQTPFGKSELVDVLRLVIPPGSAWVPGIATRFSLGTDTQDYSGGYSFRVVAGCDFFNATNIQGFGPLGNFSTNPQTMAFNITTAFHPVIEYKGLV